MEWARRLWREAGSPRGSLSERYLTEERGLGLPDALCGTVVRHHPRLWLRERQVFVPGMIAAFRPIHGDRDPDSPPCGIQRWFLDGSGTDQRDEKNRPILCLRGENGKRLKPTLGQIKGAAIKLSADEDVTTRLAVTEGFESALAAFVNGLRPVWALGGTQALIRFRPLSGVEALTILADNDASGVGLNAAQACEAAWLAAGADVCVLLRPETGCDPADFTGEAR